MGQLTIRKVDDDLIRRLKLRAAANNRSAEAEVRAILEEVLPAADAAAWREQAAELARRHARPDRPDGVELIRRMREERTEQILDAIGRRS
jgi:plasmid stability protein